MSSPPPLLLILCRSNAGRLVEVDQTEISPAYIFTLQHGTHDLPLMSDLTYLHYLPHRTLTWTYLVFTDECFGQYLPD